MNKLFFVLHIVVMASVVGWLAYSTHYTPDPDIITDSYCEPSIKALEQELRICFEKVDGYRDAEDKGASFIVESLSYCNERYSDIERAFRLCVEELQDCEMVE